MRIAVVRFPGSNCDTETLRAAERAGADAYFVWHRDSSLRDADVAILPGGFAYGDYLRAGAIARFSPIVTAVVRHAEAGGAVLGICNGFQVLCEAGLLPGALTRNAGQRFVSRPVPVRVESTDTPFTRSYSEGAIINLPVAHGEGRFVAPEHVVDQLEADGRVVFRYAGMNPNGSVHDIAAVSSDNRMVVGMMPHPERAADRIVGDTTGAGVFESMLTSAQLLARGVG